MGNEERMGLSAFCQAGCLAWSNSGHGGSLEWLNRTLSRAGTGALGWDSSCRKFTRSRSGNHRIRQSMRSRRKILRREDPRDDRILLGASTLALCLERFARTSSSQAAGSSDWGNLEVHACSMKGQNTGGHYTALHCTALSCTPLY